MTIMQRPSQRQPQFNVSAAPALASAWRYSAERFQHIIAAIDDCLPDFVACVAVSGSLARMEAHEHSDIDLIIVVDDRHQSVSDADATAAFNDVWDRLDSLRAVRPKHGGIFSVCARWKDLIDLSARGRIDESIVTFGHRIQLLMDAQPVTSPDHFEEVQKEILHWYSETRLAAIFDEPGPFHWLWQDVQRYWRSLRSRTCWLNADDEVMSLALNVKLRSSRLMLVFAFLKTLDQSCSAMPPPTSAIDHIVSSLHRTPAERLLIQPQTMTSWNSIWEFLRGTAIDPAFQLPADIQQALAELAALVAETIANTGRDSHSQQWLM